MILVWSVLPSTCGGFCVVFSFSLCSLLSLCLCLLSGSGGDLNSITHWADMNTLLLGEEAAQQQGWGFISFPFLFLFPLRFTVVQLSTLFVSLRFFFFFLAFLFLTEETNQKNNKTINIEIFK